MLKTLVLYQYILFRSPLVPSSQCYMIDNRKDVSTGKGRIVIVANVLQ